MLRLQADVSDIGGKAETEVTQHETTTFTGAVGDTVGVATVPDSLAEADAITDAGLETFLSRPVRIATINWAEADTIGVKTSISPWNLFFNNTQIKYKLNNFAFIRCNLKVKVIVNASPFYYGWMKMCYQPLPSLTPTTNLPTQPKCRYQGNHDS